MEPIKILTIQNKKDEKFLRKKTASFDFSKFTRPEISDLVKRMREAMRIGNGIGLSANQIGLPLRVFVAQIPKNEESDEPSKFYAIFNPEITKFSEKKITMEEGCLSVPEVFGEVERPEKITLEGSDRYGKRIKIKAWGILARVFQHEMDHLNGILFIDRAKNVYPIKN